VDVPYEGERGRGVVIVGHRFFESQKRVVNRSVFLRSLCDGVEARVGVPEGLFARLRDVALCVRCCYRLLWIGRREIVGLPAGGYRFSWSCREVLSGEVQEGYEDEEEREGGVEPGVWMSGGLDCLCGVNWS
jgi:hypothetical protein